MGGRVVATFVASLAVCCRALVAPPVRVRLRPVRAGGGGERAAPDDDVGAPDDAMMAELRERMLAEELRAKKDEVRGGGNRLAAQYVALLTRQHPSELVTDFYASASPEAQGAIQDAIVGLLGAGAVDAEFTTTGGLVAELCFRLQMTGYMLRNAEYVLAVQKVLALAPAGRTPAAMRAAFQRVDADGSGYIDAAEVATLFDDVYGDPPAGATAAEANELRSRKAADVASFVRFFDANADGRISYDEFCAALGGADATRAQRALEAYGGAASVDRQLPAAGAAPAPEIGGELRVGGATVSAADYVAELRAEADRLRTALARASGPSTPSAFAAIGTYIASLAPDQRELLTSTMTPDARDAARGLVDYVLSGSGGVGADGERRALAPDQQVTLERQVLDQICRWQIVVGYRLRELEASGEAAKRLGA